MKRKCLMGVLCLMLMISFVACSKDSDKKQEDNTKGKEIQESEAMGTSVNQELLAKNGVAFSETGYFYPKTVEVGIIGSKPGKIYYTTDGKDPDKEQELYIKPIKLKTDTEVKATVIKAKAFFDDGSESETIVHTYFVGETVQKRYDTLIFSVTTDPYNLYDYEYGIFVEGKLRDDYIEENPYDKIEPNDPANFNMRGKESERKVYLEILEPDGTIVVEQPAGIRTYGGWSRANLQKSIKMYARKEYSEDNNKFRYEFFPNRYSAEDTGKVLDDFKQLVLRNSGNDNGFGFIRDELFQTLVAQAGYMDYEAVRPAALYVNGEYRGIFWLHEVYCDEYFEDHYGKYSGEIQILEGGEKFKNPDEDKDNSQAISDYETMYAYSQLDLTDDVNYQKLCELVDVDNYLSYYALQVYIGNEDWPHNNYKTYRYYAAEGEDYKAAPFDGKWRYLLHDLDFSYGIYTEGDVTDNIGRYIGTNGEIRDEAPLFGALLQREDCKEIFIKKTLDLLNGAFAPNNLNGVLANMHESRLNEQKNMYGKNLVADWVQYEQLEWRMEQIRSYGKQRVGQIISRYQEYFHLGDLYTLSVQEAEGIKMKINSFVTEEYFEGTYYTDYNTTVNAILPEGKTFSHWIVNGETVETEELVITSAMIKDDLVQVTYVTE